MSSKPTAGEWKADWTRAGKVAWRVMDSKKRSIVTILATQDRPPAEKQANAALIAEAGTVLHETGLSPRQLAEQRTELIDQLELAEGALASATESGTETSLYSQTLASVSAALAKVRGGAA